MSFHYLLDSKRWYLICCLEITGADLQLVPRGSAHTSTVHHVSTVMTVLVENKLFRATIDN